MFACLPHAEVLYMYTYFTMSLEAPPIVICRLTGWYTIRWRYHCAVKFDRTKTLQECTKIAFSEVRSEPMNRDVTRTYALCSQRTFISWNSTAEEHWRSCFYLYITLCHKKKTVLWADLRVSNIKLWYGTTSASCKYQEDMSSRQSLHTLMRYFAGHKRYIIRSRPVRHRRSRYRPISWLQS